MKSIITKKHLWARVISDQFSTPEQWLITLREIGISWGAACHFIVEISIQHESWRN